MKTTLLGGCYYLKSGAGFVGRNRLTRYLIWSNLRMSFRIVKYDT